VSEHDHTLSRAAQFDTAVQEKTSSPAWLEKFAIELPALPAEINLQVGGH